MKSLFVNLALLVFIAVSTGCTSYSRKYNDFVDQDDNAFKSVLIGEQEWMESNLQVSTFRNGAKITQAKNASEWYTAYSKKKPAWCWKNFNKNNKSAGKFYNYYALVDKRGLAPKEWKIPSVKDYQINISVPLWFGSYSSILAHKSSEGWNWSCNGNNSSGLNVFPHGYCNTAGVFKDDCCSYFWTISSVINDENPKASKATDAFFIKLKTCDCSDYSTARKGVGMPVRCIKN
jgi:uncharacterized protein (TIGR02145 family)